jgi:proteasome lid subunit RPN8/RPN11
MIEDIREHFEKEYPREGCGVIGIVKGKKRFFPCRNVAVDEDDFVMSSEDYMHLKQRVDIFAIVHSHPDASNEASENDINNCDALGIPYYIFSYPEMDLNIVEPKVNVNPLLGREYKFGVHDCFEASRDYLAEQNIHIAARDPFEDDWWLKGLDYFTEDRLNEWGFHKVDTPQKNDVLIFQIEAQVPNHCGVYMQNDIFFHHAVNRLSCRESLYPFWIEHIVGIYRHEHA